MNLRRLNSGLLLVGEHSYLDSSDECYFLTTYECHLEPLNKDSILSLKRGEESAISRAVAELASVIPPEWARHYFFTPMPSSSGSRGVLNEVVNRLSVTTAGNLLIQNCKTPSSHQGWRPTPLQRQSLLQLSYLQAADRPKAVVIVDDVLTTGSHFRAAKAVIRAKWPHIRVIGLFLARVCSRWSTHCQWQQFTALTNTSANQLRKTKTPAVENLSRTGNGESLESSFTLSNGDPTGKTFLGCGLPQMCGERLQES
jgi:predicted amidophosphoribosyltransferase